MKIIVYDNSMTSTMILQITTTRLQKNYKKTTGELQVCRLQLLQVTTVTTRHYRIRGNVTWFADVPPPLHMSTPP
jgi:hypothetical protein